MCKQSSANIKLILMIATMALVFTLVGTVHATPMVDQEQDQIGQGYSIWRDNLEYQQGITPGIVGQLTSVSLFFETSEPSFEFLFGLNFGSGWQVDLNDFQTTWQINNSGWNSLDISSANIFLGEDATFNFVLNGIHGESEECQDCRIGFRASLIYDLDYGGGTFMSRFIGDPVVLRDGDLAFRTYVEVAPVPEPSTIFLIGAGLAGMFAFRKKILKSV